MTPRRSPLGRRVLLRRWFAVGLALLPTPARAWDPATTHVGLSDRAALAGPVHRRWMSASDGRLGMFAPLRIDPNALPPSARRLVLRAVEAAPEDVGARPRGGPGACPEPPAPPGTRDRCVEGDLWEATALGWIRLGIVAETVPPERMLAHFFDPADFERPTWEDSTLARVVARGRHTRANGATISSFVARSAPGRGGPSALAHLEDPQNPLGLAALARHLEDLARAEAPGEREHHLALALTCVGAVLHVAQDATVPAHARGDLAAFFAPLSETPGDRGLPLAAYAARLYGRTDLPLPLALAPRGSEGDGPPPLPPGIPALPDDGDLRTLLLGDGPWPGLAPFAARNFLSDAALAEPRRLSARDPKAAAAELLAGTGLAEHVIEGATLDRWPAAEHGYVRTRTGRALAAWRRLDDDRIALYATRHVYRDQAGHLLPLAMVASEWILERVFRPPPEVSWDGGRLRVSGDVVRKQARLVAFVEDDDGRRTILASTEIDRDGTTTVRVERRPEGVVLVGRRGNLPWISMARLAPGAHDRKDDRAGASEPVQSGESGARPTPTAAPDAARGDASAEPEASEKEAPDGETPQGEPAAVAPPTAPLPRRP